MRKIIMTAIMSVCAVLSYASIEVAGDKAVITAKDYKLSFQMTTGDKLRVKLDTNGEEPKTGKFYINKESANITPVKDGEMVKIGEYTILETEKGYTLKNKEKTLYSSEFVINKKNIQETKSLLDGELIYGMGEESAALNLEGRRMKMNQVSVYGNQAFLYIPFYFTNGGDSFYYNGNNNDVFKFGKREESVATYITTEKSLDYYYSYQPSMKKAVADFYNFSDSKSMVPKWAFGYIQSKYGYKNQQEVVDLVNKFKEKNITPSAVVLDLYWYKKMGDFDWNKADWPNPQEMKKLLNENNIKLITITEPFLTEDSKYYKEFEDNGLLGKKADGTTLTWDDWWCFGAKYGGILNPFAPKAQEIIGKKYTDMYKSGTDGFWTDLGEPENTAMTTKFNEYKEEEIHNYYNREWSKLIYNAMKSEFPDYRLFILSRSGFTGSGKYGVSVWSGDSESSFASLKKQIGYGLNSGISGLSYWGSDVGGFAGQWKKIAEDKWEPIPQEELFIRWMQFGAFSPVFRAHAAHASREPWAYPGKAEEIVTSYINMRNSLMPYIYSTAYQTYKDGIPMMRPMYMEYQNDRECLIGTSQYMFGDSLLVAPIVDEKSVTENKTVYFPDDKWYDYYTLQKQPKGKITIKAEIEKIPVYVKEGAIIPMFDKNNNLSIFAIPRSEKSTFTLYDDDGVSNKFEKGDFEAITIEMDKTGITFKNVKTEKTINVKLLKDAVTTNELTNFTTDNNTIGFKVNLKAGENRVNF